MNTIETGEKGVSVRGVHINKLRFADDITILEDAIQLQKTVQKLNEEGWKRGLTMDFEKSKAMAICKQKHPTQDRG
jgi:hypothetical protein